MTQGGTQLGISQRNTDKKKSYFGDKGEKTRRTTKDSYKSARMKQVGNNYTHNSKWTGARRLLYAFLEFRLPRPLRNGHSPLHSGGLTRSSDRSGSSSEPGASSSDRL